MSDLVDGGNEAADEAGSGGKHGIARELVEAALRARRGGELDRSDSLLEEARRTDPQAVENLLMELAPGEPAPGSPDRFDPASSDREVELISRTIAPDADAPSRAGITDAGSGADSQ